MQGQIRNFYDNFGARIRFMREKRGLTLQELAGTPSSSTAKSWEDGSKPRPEKWEAVAKRLNLSVSFVFLGEPKTPEDYDFIAKFTDEIGGKKDAGDEPWPLNDQPELMVKEDSTPFADPPDYSAISLKREARLILDQVLLAAGNDRKRLGWIIEQLHSHLNAPSHWGRTTSRAPGNPDNHPVIRDVLQSAHQEHFRREASRRASDPGPGSKDHPAAGEGS